MQVLSGDVAQGFRLLLACPVSVGVLGEGLVSTIFSCVSNQAVGRGAKWYQRIRLKSRINVGGGVRGGGRWV